MEILRRLHTACRAWLLKYFRTREVVRVFKQAHAVELQSVPVTSWPLIKARQEQELQAVRAGKLDIVDRKSWAWPFLPSCFDVRTEIMTRRGFIPVEDMRDDDIFATRNAKGFFEWQPADTIVRQRYRGPMLHFSGLHMSALVTPNHRMLIRQKDKARNHVVSVSTEKILKAEDIFNDPAIQAAEGYQGAKHSYRYCEVPLKAKPKRALVCSAATAADVVVLHPILRSNLDRSRTLRINRDVWIQFLALYLADGSCDGTIEGIEFGEGKLPYNQHAAAWDKLYKEFQTNPLSVADRVAKNFRVRITCKMSSSIREEVGTLLRQMPGMSWNPRQEHGFSCGSKALWTGLFPFGNCYTKYVPQWIKDLPTEKLELFAEWLKKTDAWVHDEYGYGEYVSTSKQLAEDVAEIFVQLGYSVNVRPREQASGAIAYGVRFHQKDYGKISSIKQVPYNGYVYCPSTKNGIVCVRRNGKIHWSGNSVTRLATPIIKATPFNLRRMSRTPVPRRAINLIKNAIISQPWDITPIDDVPALDNDEQGQQERCRISRKIFNHPNNQDSFQSYIEQGLEDHLLFGAFVSELRETPDIKRPLKLWPVNVESIRLFASWTESTPEMPRYAQMTGLKGERGAVLFYDDELMYLKDNPSTDNPFGLGKMEVAFQQVSDFLGVQGMAGRAGTDQVHKTWMWWEQPQADAHYQIVRRHIQNELEGQAKVSIIGGMKKPEVLEINPVTEADLLLNWQELLIRIIALAFDMSALSFIEHDINRAVGSVLDDKDFRSAVVPVAKRLQEAFTRKILHEKLGWYDLRFQFLNLDDPDKQTMIEICSRMYSANSITPNQIRKKMGEEPLSTPLADLTQVEAMMVNMEAMVKAQEQMTNRQQDRQQQQQQEQQQQQFEQQKQMIKETGVGYGPGGGPPQPATMGNPMQQQMPGPGSSLKTTPGNVAKGGQPPSPKPLALPKFPIAGSRYSAKEIAQMPVNQLVDRFYNGEIPTPVSNTLQQMQEQEPTILEQMSDEVREFFDEALEQEKKQELKDRKVKPGLMKKWEKGQKKKFQDDQQRIDDFATWLQKKGAFLGKPGGGNTPRAKNAFTSKPGAIKPGGKPGNVNRIQRW